MEQRPSHDQPAYMADYYKDIIRDTWENPTPLIDGDQSPLGEADDVLPLNKIDALLRNNPRQNAQYSMRICSSTRKIMALTGQLCNELSSPFRGHPEHTVISQLRSQGVDPLVRVIQWETLCEMFIADSNTFLTSASDQLTQNPRQWPPVNNRPPSESNPPEQYLNTAYDTHMLTLADLKLLAQDVNTLLNNTASIREQFETARSQEEVFRPSWAATQNAGFGRLHNLLAREQRLSKDDARHITRLLHGLAATAARDEEQAHAAIKKVAHNEPSLRALAAHLYKVNPSHDLEWRPLSEDMRYLFDNWSELQQLSRRRWPRTDGHSPDTHLGRVKDLLDTFAQARMEAENPANRLSAVAQRLGAVALPPEARPAGTNVVESTSGEIAARTLQDIMHDINLDPQTRQRAQVINHFLNLAQSQRRPGDTESFGILYESESQAPDYSQYFCVLFRTADERVWVLLESLEHEKATYAIPLELVQISGKSDKEALRSFLSQHNKPEQIMLGGKQIIHSTGWTPESHIDRIQARTAGDTDTSR